MHFMTYVIPTGMAFQTADGSAYTLRRVTQADAALLNTFLQRLSAQTRWMRFMSARPYSRESARAEVARLLAGSAGSSITLVVTQERDGAAVAVAELHGDHARHTGEVALVVMDDMQRKGIGGVLLRTLVQIAQELDLTHLHGYAFAANEPLRHLIRALQISTTVSRDAGEMQVIVRVPQPHMSSLVGHEPMPISEKARMDLDCESVSSPA